MHSCAAPKRADSPTESPKFLTLMAGSDGRDVTQRRLLCIAISARGNFSLQRERRVFRRISLAVAAANGTYDAHIHCYSPLLLCTYVYKFHNPRARARAGDSAVSRWNEKYHEEKEIPMLLARRISEKLFRPTAFSIVQPSYRRGRIARGT